MKLLNYLFADKILVCTFIISCLTLSLGIPSHIFIDWHTIFSLTALLICVELFNENKILNNLSIMIKNRALNTKLLTFSLTILSFFGSMIFTNDVAILIIIPMAVRLFNELKIKYYFPITLIIISANLGSSITPFGNPQNIFLISQFHLKIIDFFKISIPLGLISLGLIIMSILFIKKKQLPQTKTSLYRINKAKLTLTSFILVLILLGIFNIIPIVISLLITILLSILINYKVFKKIDYRLILTFILFFIAINNLTNSQVISNFLEEIIQSNQSLQIFGLVLCQIISNVPTTILLSNYSDNYQLIYQSVTIGGLGTIIASLANLLAVKQIMIYDQKQKIGKFILYFSLINVAFIILIILLTKILNI